MRPVDDPLVEELRRFILSYGEHDGDCPGAVAQGAAVTDPGGCECGFIARLEELLQRTAARLRPSDL